MSRIKMKQAKGVGRITLDYGIDQFLRHCRLKNLSPKTIEYYTEDLRYFQRTTEVTYLDEINDKLYEDFILHEMDKGNKMTAVNCRTRGLRVFLRFCAKREYMEPVTIPMGVSQGGMIAQYLAIDHPDLVERLVLAVTAPRVNEIIEGCVSRWIGFAEQGNHKALMIDTAEKSYSEAYLRKYRKIYPLIGAIGKPKNYDRFLVNARAILGFNAYEDLYRITCPTLIIGGNDDKTVGIEASYELKERIAGSALYVYPGLGHAAYEEAKDFNQRVYDFLRGTAI